jgi:hypothetical protein
LAALYRDQGKLSEAAPLPERALAICKKVLGAEHPETVRSLEDYAALLLHMSRVDGASQGEN